MSGSLGNLQINVSANIAGLTSNMDQAARVSKASMVASAASVNDFRTSVQQAANDSQRATQSIASNMEAANDAIISNSQKSAAAIQNVADTANKADFQPMSDRLAEAVGRGIGAGIVAAEKGWDTFVEYSKTKAVIVGLAVSAAFAAVGLGAIYTAYKVISGSLGFITGLLTGDSYKSDNIDALINANNQIKEIQKSLVLTAQEAAATNAALAALGVDKSAYISTFQAAADAVHENTDELDRLGVAYKDAQGKLLPLSDVIKNANDVLASYTEGWDRNKAATAIGLGSAADVAAAATVTAEKIEEARNRLNDYNLGIGEESQAAVKAYEDAMRAFNRETELTSQGFKRAVADNIMPLLTDLADFFKEGFPTAVNAFRYSIATVTTLFYGLKEAIYIVAESILGSIDAIAKGVTGLAVAAAKALTGDFSGAQEAMVSGWNEAKDRMAQIGANIVAQHQHNAAAVRQAWAMDDRAAPAAAAAKGKSWVPRPDEPDTTETRAAVDPFSRDMMNLDRTKASLDYVIANFDKFSGKVKESKAAMAEFDVTLGKYSDTQRRLEGFEPLTAAQKAQYVEKSKLIDEAVQKERQLQTLRQFDKSADELVFREKQSLDARRQDIDLMGRSQVEIAKLTEARRIDAEVQALIYKTQLDLGKEGLTITQQQIDSINQRAEAAKAASLALIDKQDQKARDPWFNATESIRKYGEEVANVGAQIGSAMTNAAKSMEDAFVKFATTGKFSFSSLANSVIADILRMQARAAVSGIMGYVANIAGAYFGGADAAAAAPGASDIQGGVTQFAAEGGYISGPGTGTSDDIPARLSNGEFVINAAATARNRSLLEAINSGRRANGELRFAAGGYVGANSVAPSTAGGAPNVQLINQSGTQLDASAQMDGNGDLVVLLTRAVTQSIAGDVASGQGAITKSLKSRYNLKPATA
ncbi:phage tail tape measure C-terminal domain-containing protein [Herbaspirillum frisingense]|uniref:Lambda family phage tail tape measure protein n=1 Tax=Herbaspirillum frisingense TaxID=92645 RepID=A0ABU1PI58_9BURK|nr:phage tail tape measure C-terminal domain-containing protein [Herbaspirillum frisingense]MDR6585524.1 lambda family phage tail tape measure protein [Herbaspirillum frisingense]